MQLAWFRHLNAPSRTDSQRRRRRVRALKEDRETDCQERVEDTPSSRKNRNALVFPPEGRPAVVPATDPHCDATDVKYSETSF